MIPALDFAVLPPEVNSGRMYAGAGPGPMLAAASAWNGLAAELCSAATGYMSVLSQLNVHWHGPTSASMMAATMPYVAWLNATAEQAERAALGAEAAVAAYEAAFAATVAPTVVATNRARLMLLVATNILGQNTPAIAAAEAEYAEMWAQDACAMYGYAAASSAATELAPFNPPGQITSPGGLITQSAVVTRVAGTPASAQQGVLSQLIGGWNPFAPGSASDTTGLNGLLNAIFGTDTAFGQFANSNVVNTIFMSAFYMPAKHSGSFIQFVSGGQQGGAPRESGVGASAPQAESVPLNKIAVQANSSSTGVGRGAQIGPLSVPASWAPSIPAPSWPAATSALAPLVAPASQAGSTPPVPLAGKAGTSGEGRAVPQYGFRPSFVARPPAAG